MKCPYCGYNDSKVVDSRAAIDGIRRRRQCLQCTARFTTYERIEVANFMVVKKDGRREEYSREKVVSGVRKACTKRPVTRHAIERLVDEVEEELHRRGQVEVQSSTIGSLVMRRLLEIDRIAYVRFASVYRAFTNLDSFKEEVDALERGEGWVPSAQLPLIAPDTFATSSRSGSKKERT